MFVCLGVDARGGGSRGVFRDVRVLSTSGPEPGDGSVSIVDAGATKMSDADLYDILKLDSLSWMFISLLLSVLSPLRCGETGDEKMCETGSRPCSSRIPGSLSVSPVFLDHGQHTHLLRAKYRVGYAHTVQPCQYPRIGCLFSSDVLAYCLCPSSSPPAPCCAALDSLYLDPVCRLSRYNVAIF